MNMYEIMFIVGAILAGIFLVFAIVFFVKDDVAKRIGDVTGWTAKHEIKKRTQMGAEAVSKNEALHAKDADIVVKNLELSEDEATDLLSEEATTLLAEEATELLVDEATTLLVNEETELLADEATTLLVNEETEFLTEEETTLLTNEDAFIDEEETGLLTSGDTEWLMKDRATYETAKEETFGKGVEMPSVFEVEEETVVVHTEESI